MLGVPPAPVSRRASFHENGRCWAEDDYNFEDEELELSSAGELFGEQFSLLEPSAPKLSETELTDAVPPVGSSNQRVYLSQNIYNRDPPHGLSEWFWKLVAAALGLLALYLWAFPPRPLSSSAQPRGGEKNKTAGNVSSTDEEEVTHSTHEAFGEQSTSQQPGLSAWWALSCVQTLVSMIEGLRSLMQFAKQ